MQTPDVGATQPNATWQSVAAWIAVGLALRSLLAAAAPLFPDETYYWEWSRRLASGYFDHPPAIAYLIAAGTGLFGDTVAGVRTGSAFAAIVVHVTACVAAYRFGGMMAARRAALLTTIIPLATLGLVLATPDAPLLACAALTIVCLDGALSSKRGTARSTTWWCLSGFALGVALLSKYTAVLLPASLFVACLVDKGLRDRFREIGPYVATVIATLVFSPVVAWNANHDWISFRFQLGHGLGTGAKGNVLTRELELIGGQLALATPILAVLLALATWRALKARSGSHSGNASNVARVVSDGATQAVAVSENIEIIRQRRFALAAMALGPLVFFAISATRKSVEANWPALSYPAAIVLLASVSQSDALARWWKRGVALAALVLVVAVVQTWKPVLPLAPRKDPIARAHGWSQLAAAMDSVSRDDFLEAQRSSDVLTPNANASRWFAAERYQEASELAFHLPNHPDVLSLNIAGRANQYDVWQLSVSAIQPGDDVVASFDANPEGDARAARMAEWFRDVKQGPMVALRRGGGEVAHRRIWLFRSAVVIPRDSTARTSR